MTTSLEDLHPYSTVVPKQVRILSANTSMQLALAPWMQTPFEGTLIIEDIQISNFNGAAGALHIWDQDLTNTGAPAGKGSAGAALITIGFAASGASGTSASQTNASVSQGSLMAKNFRAGIAMQSTVLNVNVMANVRRID